MLVPEYLGGEPARGRHRRGAQQAPHRALIHKDIMPAKYRGQSALTERQGSPVLAAPVVWCATRRSVSTGAIRIPTAGGRFDVIGNTEYENCTRCRHDICRIA